jgi:hypothetical protein
VKTDPKVDSGVADATSDTGRSGSPRPQADRRLDEVLAKLVRIEDAVERLMKRADQAQAALTSMAGRSPGPRAPTRLSIGDLVARFGVSRTTIGVWCRSGKLPRPHYVAGNRRWWLHEIEAAEATMTERRWPGRDLQAREPE